MDIATNISILPAHLIYQDISPLGVADLNILFELDNSFDVNYESLEKKYLSFQKSFHPDKFVNASDQEKRISLQIISYINEAYETLKNDYLKNYALKFNSNVTILPSTVNTDLYKPMNLNGHSGKVKIGWVGSHTTIKHFQKIIVRIYYFK